MIRGGKLLLFGGTTGWNRNNLAIMAPITALTQYIVFGIPLEQASELVYYRPKQPTQVCVCF